MMPHSKDFETASPINADKLSGQNLKVFQILSEGKTINCIEAQNIGITALNSRISDLRNKAGVVIHDRFIKTSGGSNIKEYSLSPFKRA